MMLRFDLLKYNCRDKKKANQEEKLLIKQLEKSRREAEKEKESIPSELQRDVSAAVFTLLCVFIAEVASSLMLLSLALKSRFLHMFKLNISITKMLKITSRKKKKQQVFAVGYKWDGHLTC